MSKLQFALRALPPESVVTAQIQADARAVNARIDSAVRDEVLGARRLQTETGCSWAEAIRAHRLGMQGYAGLWQPTRKGHP